MSESSESSKSPESFDSPKSLESPELPDTSTTEKKSKGIRPLVYCITGGIGGFFAVIINKPLQNGKTLLKIIKAINVPFAYPRNDNSFRTVKKQGNLRGLYDGLNQEIMFACPSYATVFASYGLGKSLQELAHDGENMEFTALNYFLAGGMSGIVTSLVMSPFEYRKLLLQLQQTQSNESQLNGASRHGTKQTGILDAVSKLYHQGGMKSVYKGTLMTFMRDIPAFGIFFMTYELLKENLKSENTDSLLSVKEILFAGGISGIAYWLVALPCNNIRRRLLSAPHLRYRSVLKDTFAEIYKKKSITDLYTGFLPVIYRTFPGNAVCFLEFEYSNNEFFKVSD